MKTVAFATILALGLATQANAEVRIEASTSYYDLNGLTMREIHHSLMHNAPREGGQIIEGEVADHFSVVFRTKLDGNFCRPVEEFVTLKLKILLPKWADEERATTSVRMDWQRYMKKLVAHENGHKEIALSAANAVHRIFHDVSAKSSCKELDANVKRAANRAIAEAEEQQEAWDKNAEHFGIE